MLRQFLSGSKAILKNKAIVNGQILFPNDASEIYYDINNVRRTVYGLFYVDNDVDLVGIANPEEKLYFSHGSNRVFAYDADTQEFTQVNRTGVVNNLTSAQRNALTSCVEDSIYIDSDTLEMYIGTNMGSNSLSASMFGNVYWHKIGESISNYNGLVSIRTSDKNVLSTNISGDITIGDSSNSCSINTSNLRLNNNAQNTANGVVVLDNNGKILQSLIPQGSGTATSSPIIETINVTTISPEHNKIYHATLSDNDVFTFISPQNNNEVLSFRLYLTMPQTLVSFTLPTNIVWDEQSNFTTSNALYMLVFEWNPLINRWLGNLMWGPVSLSDYSNSGSGSGESNSGDTSYAFSISGITNPAEANGNYIEQSSRVYKHETNEYYVSREQDYNYWSLSPVVNPVGPEEANFYGYGSATKANPWEVTDWRHYSTSTQPGAGTLVITQGGSSGDDSDSSSGYDYDKLTASGFEGFGLNNTGDVSYLNGTWTRITTTDDATLQANGFKTEQWQLDDGTSLLLHNGSEWVVMSPTMEIVKEINQYATPWDVPAGEWYGETMLPVGSSASFTKTGSGDAEGTPDYIVSGSSNEDANGDYYLTDETGVGSTPVYKNENGYAIKKAGIGWGIHDGTSLVHLISGSMNIYDVPTGTFDGFTITKG